MTLALMTVLALATAWVWWLAWRRPPAPRSPAWGTRLEARLRQTCPLCGSRRHTVREHVRLPQAVLRAREEGGQRDAHVEPL